MHAAFVTFCRHRYSPNSIQCLLCANSDSYTIGLGLSVQNNCQPVRNFDRDSTPLASISLSSHTATKCAGYRAKAVQQLFSIFACSIAGELSQSLLSIPNTRICSSGLYQQLPGSMTAFCGVQCFTSCTTLFHRIIHQRSQQQHPCLAQVLDAFSMCCQTCSFPSSLQKLIPALLTTNSRTPQRSQKTTKASSHLKPTQLATGILDTCWMSQAMLDKAVLT